MCINKSNNNNKRHVTVQSIVWKIIMEIGIMFSYVCVWIFVQCSCSANVSKFLLCCWMRISSMCRYIEIYEATEHTKKSCEKWKERKWEKQERRCQRQTMLRTTTWCFFNSKYYSILLHTTTIFLQYNEKLQWIRKRVSAILTLNFFIHYV